MSAAELIWRSRCRARLELWKRRRDWPSRAQVADSAHSAYRFPAVHAPQCLEPIVRQADGQLDGRTVALGQTFSSVETDWHLDPQSGLRSPLRFGPLLNYRDAHLVGNVRNTWELNRHQHLTVAALAFALTGEDRYATYVRCQLESWLHQNPFPLGVNWSSPLELGLRLISWVWISRFLAGSGEREELFGKHGHMWPAIYRHQWMIANLHSVGSSANNHLIGEMAGLFVAAVEWPFFAESPSWTRLAYGMLSAESERQYYPSGLNREQAFGYHLFTTELLVLAGIEGERAGRPFGEDYRGRLRRAVTAAIALVGPGGLLPAYGDSDDGVAIGLPGSSHVLGRLSAVVTDWLGGVAGAIPPSVESQMAASILLSGVLAAPRTTGAADSPGAAARTHAFADAGLFVMASRDRDVELNCLADAGELGYLSIAAHGHADALSFTLAAGEEQLLIDPGTYTYHFDPEARAYFRGTRAHNTITIDGRDQSQSGGPFLWTRKARTTVDEWEQTEQGAVLSASHDGYTRLADPLWHARTLRLKRGHLTVDDFLAGHAPHDVEWRLHMAPHCEVQLGERTCEIVGCSHRLSIQLDEALEWSLHVADAQGGWYSRSFNRRQPATTLVGKARLALPARLHHELRVSG